MAFLRVFRCTAEVIYFTKKKIKIKKRINVDGVLCGRDEWLEENLSYVAKKVFLVKSFTFPIVVFFYSLF